jgi:SAM-dependent methyltransferase
MGAHGRAPSSGSVRSMASRWARRPSRSKMTMTSTGSPSAVIACGDIVENCAACPVSTRMTRSPSCSRSTVKSMSDTDTHDHQSPHDEHPPHNHHSPHDDHSHGQDAHQHGGAAADNYTDLLEWDAEVLHDYWSAALDWVREAADGAIRARLLDLGSGTGTGAIGLAQRFPGAEVVALDISPVSVARVSAKAAGLGLGSRVRAVEADLDLGWPDLGWAAAPAPDAPVLDLTWASMSLHHMADPGQVLRDALGATRPGGLIAVAEFSQPLRFLPDDLGFGRPGFESRIAETLGHAHTELMPTLGSEWAPRLAEAGWHVVAERDFPIDLDPPSHPDAPRYARAWFARLSEGLAGRLETGDHATLTELLDESSPRSVLRRANLHIRGVRTVTLARRD